MEQLRFASLAKNNIFLNMELGLLLHIAIALMMLIHCKPVQQVKYQQCTQPALQLPHLLMLVLLLQKPFILVILANYLISE